MNEAEKTTQVQVNLVPVNAENWRRVAGLEVAAEQRNYVAAPTYYLCLCHYGGLWQPLAIQAERGGIIGLLMWAADEADGSCWLGGILIDQKQQGKGYGRRAVVAAIAKLAREHGYRQFALSYQPGNIRARQLYLSLGFVETGETEDDEVVARLTLPAV